MAREFKRRLQGDCREDKLFLQPLLMHWYLPMPQKGNATRSPTISSEAQRHMNFPLPIWDDWTSPYRLADGQVETFLNVVNSSPYERTVGVNTLASRMMSVLASRASLLPQEKSRTSHG